MPDLAQAITFGATLAVLAAGVLAFFKRKPGERQSEIISVGVAEIDIAKGAVFLTQEAAESQRLHAKWLEEQMSALRLEMNTMRKQLQDAFNDVDALRDKVRKISEERDNLSNENMKLGKRVKVLEDEITRLGGKLPDTDRK